jgi:hypothetical protein
MTLATRRGAISRLGQLAIRTDAGLGVEAPEQAIVGRRDRRVLVHADELLLPPQGCAQGFATGIEAFVIGQ